jgi:hypothetical protein
MGLFKRNRGNGAVRELGYILALIGGIVMILLSLAGILNFAVNIPFQSPILGYFGVGIISLILGVVALYGAKRVSVLLWAVVLIVIGFLGGGIGGLFVLLGGIVGLISRYI